jgi:hypothetical protein
MRRQLASVPRTYGLASSGARPVVALLLLVCTAVALSLPRSGAPQDSTCLTIPGQPEEFSNAFRPRPRPAAGRSGSASCFLR